MITFLRFIRSLSLSSVVENKKAEKAGRMCLAYSCPEKEDANRFVQRETATNVPGFLGWRLLRIVDAGGVMEISRWRKPPVPHTICNEPRRGDGMLGARFPPPLAGAWANVHDMNRWLAPPANLQCPSGTIRIISSNKSPDATSSRRFEVEDS